MKFARELRLDARNSLKGKWGAAVGAGFVASLLGGIVSSVSTPDVEFKVSTGSGQSSSLSLTDVAQSMGVPQQTIAAIVSGILIAAVVFLLVYTFIGCAVEVGYARFNLDLLDGKEARVATLFGDFKRWGTTFAARFLRGLFIVLWSMLFFIPGLIASFSYAMTSYVLADNPGMSARQAITVSKNMMRGNRWRLFCLEFSFIGWAFLNLFTLGIGSLWLNPYINAATAAFYRELTGPVKAAE